MIKKKYIFSEPNIQLKCWIGDFACLTTISQANSPVLAAGILRVLKETTRSMFVDNVHVDKAGLHFDMNNIIVQDLKDPVIDNVR